MHTLLRPGTNRAYFLVFQSTCIASTIYTDTSGTFTARKAATAVQPKVEVADADVDAMEDESDLYGPSDDAPTKLEQTEEPPMTVDEGVTSSVENMMDAGKGTQWLCLTFATGAFEVSRAAPA